MKTHYSKRQLVEIIETMQKEFADFKHHYDHLIAVNSELKIVNDMNQEMIKRLQDELRNV